MVQNACRGRIVLPPGGAKNLSINWGLLLMWMKSTEGKIDANREDAKIEPRGSCSVNMPDYRFKGTEDMLLSEGEETENKGDEEASDWKELPPAHPHAPQQGLQPSLLSMNVQINDVRNQVIQLRNRTARQFSSLSDDIRTLEEILRMLAPPTALPKLPTLPDVDPELEELESKEDGWRTESGEEDGSISVSGQT